jgi:hypothetical protein
MTQLTSAQFAVLKEACRVVGVEMYRAYSGRFMYGEKCVGIVAPGAAGATRFIMEVSKTLPVLANDLLDAQRQDDMGLDRVFYFPGWSAPGEVAETAKEKLNAARGVFVDELAGLFAAAIQAGVTEEMLRADFEGCLSVQHFG